MLNPYGMVKQRQVCKTTFEEDKIKTLNTQEKVFGI